MNFNFINQVISIILYSLFFYFYWIQLSELTAAITLVLIISYLYFKKSEKHEFNLAIVVAITHLALWLFRFSYFLQWPIDLFLLSGIGFLYLYFFCKQKIQLNWKIQFGRPEILSILAINIPAIAILFWYFSENTDIAQKWPLPSLPIWAVPFVVLLISAINGLREELYYRGLLQNLTNGKYSVWFVILFQAISFGPLHFVNAFPQGWTGVGLTALWGAAIALQYHYFRSISLSWLTHSMADAIMFSVILIVR